MGIAWLSLAAPQAMAGVTLVQHSSRDAGTSSSASLAFPANNAAGNWIGVVIRAGHSGQVLTVSDTRGNVYKQAVQFNQTLDAPNGETLAIYYAESIASGANTVTVSESLANNTLRFAILEYSGLATSNSIDVTSAAQGTGTTLNSGTATTTVGGDLILGEVSTAAGVTFTASSGYALEERVPAAPNTKIIAEDAVQVTAGAVSVSATLSVSANGGALLAAFKAAASGTLPPSITSLSPASGPAGISVVIAGANFGASQGTSNVTFNGVVATPTNWTATSITVSVPTGATTGSVVVTVGGLSSNGVAFTVPPPPIITFLNPTSSRVGYGVTINGANFGPTQGSSTVTFNGTPATPIIWGPSSITVGVPNVSSAGPAIVIVTVGGMASNGVTMTVTPGVSSLNPSSGRVGTLVTITGTEFGTTQGASTVTIGGITATPTSWSDTSILVSVPSGAATGVNGLVVTVGGIPSVSNGVNFTVTPGISSLSPASGAVGTLVTVIGTSFGVAQNSSVVSFNGTLATPTSWSDISITVPVPSGATSGNVVVTVGGAPSNGAAFTTIPSITSLYPNSGSPGSIVTITGANFGAAEGISTVSFNGTGASASSWSASSIAVVVPPGGTSGIVVVTVGGVASNGLPFTYGPDITPPTVPTNLVATAATGLLVDLSWIASTDNISVANYLIEQCQGAGCTNFTLNPPLPGNIFPSTVLGPVAPATSYSFRMRASDAAGNVSGYSNIASVTTPFGPSISNLSPTIGPQGTAVTLNGINFGTTQGTSTVTFNGTAAAPTNWSATSIVTVVPPGATSGFVVVTVGGVASNSTYFSVAYPTPTITNLNPTVGPVGTIVTISGANFGTAQGTSAVTFNGVAATPTIWSATSITVPVPTGATSGNVVVTVAGAGQPSNGLNFTVTAPPPPAIVSLTPPLGLVGTSVTITGMNFGSLQGASTVTFNGVAAVPTSWSMTSVVAPVPNGATTGNVSVTVGGVASNGSNFTVTVPAAPVTLVQHASKDAGSTSSSTLAFKSNNTAGNWIAVIARAGRSGQVFTVSDSLHNTYRMAAQFNVTVDAPNGDTLGVFYAENIAGGVNTITVADSISGNTLRFAIFEYSGVAHANSLDGVIAGQGTNAAPNSGSVTTSMNGDLLLGAAMSAGAATYSAGPGYKMEEFVPAEPNTKLIAEDQIQAVAGIASASATLGASDHWGAILAAFRPGNAGITGPAITSLSPAFGPVGTWVTINGTNFGSAQGTSAVIFNGAAAIPSSWTATSIVVPVPVGARTGTLALTVGGVASNGVTFTVTVPPPNIASLNPSSVLSGNGPFPLTVNGTNFLPSSLVQWNGVARTTSFVSITQLQAAISAADIANASVAKVTVSNPGLGGAVSSPSAFLIGSSGGSNFAVLAVNQAAQDIVYDPRNQVFYLSVANNASTNPNTISVLDPTAAAITSTQPTGINPNVLAISDDSQFLYAGIDGAASVQRFILPGLAPDISYALGSGTSGPYFALDLQVAPGAPHTTAVTLGNSGVSPAAQGGITIFDDATPRAVKATGTGLLLFDSIQWGADATALYSSNNESTGFDFYSLSVNSGGVTLNQDFQRVFRTFVEKIHFDVGTNLIYANEGLVINPSTGLPVGNFNTVGPMVVDSSLNTAFFLGAGSAYGTTIQAFDLTHFTPIGSVTIPNATGTSSHLIRWGQDGLAFISTGANGSGQVFLVGGSFVGPASAFITTPPPTPTIPPTPLPNAPTITSLLPSSAIAGGPAFVLTVAGTQFDPAAIVQFNGAALSTTFVSSTQLQAAIPPSDLLTPGTVSITVANPLASGGSSSGATFFIGASGGISSAGTGFAVKIVNQASKDILFDPVDQLFYLSVPNTNSTGNTIAVLDPTTTQIVGEQYAGSNPNIIAISDDGQFLYAGIDGSSTVQRFTLPNLSPDIRYSLGAHSSFGPYFALDLQVAPSAPHTTAVTSGTFNVSPVAEGGISIFDDATTRPTVAGGFLSSGGGLYDSLQWGSDATTLYAANDDGSSFDFYALSVNSTGVVLTSDYQNTFSSFGDRIHFDRGNKLIYSDDGHVVNPSNGASLGAFPVTGFAGSIMVPDSNLNLGFFAFKTGTSSVAVYSFNLNTFAPISLITIPNVPGNPLRLIRWGQSGLAFNTDAGEIVLVGGNFVH